MFIENLLSVLKQTVFSLLCSNNNKTE